MSEPLFDIVTFGLIQPGKDRNEVAENMARLFKTTPEKLKPYFAGGRKVIKSNVDELGAQKYQVALEKAGLVIKIEEATEAPAAKPAQQASDKQPDTGGITMAEVGSDVLKENERTVVEPQPIGDISDIDMAEVGADVLTEDERPVVEPAPIGDISDIDMAEVGADVLNEDERTVVEAVPIGDISDIDMAEVGADVLNEDERPVIEPTPIGDISDIEIAEVGADVLKEDERPMIEPAPIEDISEISMAEVGADVIENPTPKPKVEIDTSDISLVD